MALGRKPPRPEEEDRTVEISAKMQGSLSFNDPVNLKINGNFNGSLITKGTLTIGSSALVDANISGDNIVIAGKVNGDIHASVMLVLLPSAVLRGNITTPKLNIVEGAIFDGNCKMSSTTNTFDSINSTTADLLNIDEVSKYLEIDMSEIEELARNGKIPSTREGNSWKFQRNQIDNWLSSTRLK